MYSIFMLMYFGGIRRVSDMEKLRYTDYGWAKIQWFRTRNIHDGRNDFSVLCKKLERYNLFRDRKMLIQNTYLIWWKDFPINQSAEEK
jgi:hypothetical protein